MNCRHETVKMGVHPGNHRDSNSVLDSTSQGPWPEDAMKDAHILGHSRPFMKYPGEARTLPAKSRLLSCGK